MEIEQSPKKALATARSHKSIAHLPSPEVNIDKENVTIDSVVQLRSLTDAKSTSRKPRSKSIGPGGLDTLKEDTGNRRQSAVAPLVRSILKSSMRLSPPKQIPSHPSSRRASPRSSSRTTPEKTKKNSSSSTSIWLNSNPVPGSHGLPNPFERPADSTPSLSTSESQTMVAVRTEAEQQAKAKERERQDLLAHKDARRKSLANRRVSFAPEATLHTWDVVEIPEDSTTSSASTNLTRRASALSAVGTSPYPLPRSPMPSSDASEPPLTPPKQVEEIQVVASPAHQRELHQKKDRHSPGIPPMNFNNPDDFSSSPGSVTSDETGSQAFTTADEEAESSDSDVGDGLEESEDTLTGINGDDITTLSKEGSSTGSSVKLEEALRQAANQAGTQGIDYDENGDLTMEMADDEITAAFKPWMKKGKYVPQIVGDPSALQDQENVNPFSPAFKANYSESVRADHSEKTTESTQTASANLPHLEAIQPSPSPKDDKPKSTTGVWRQSSGVNRRFSGVDSILGDETMDLTTAIGGIRQTQPPHGRVEGTKEPEYSDEDEELTMEFTSVIGGVLERRNKNHVPNGSLIDDHVASRHQRHETNRRDSEVSSHNEEDMDVTIAMGGILPPVTERTEPVEDQTMDLDITTALGAILPQQLSTDNQSEAKEVLEREVDTGQLLGSPSLGNLFAGFGPSSHAATVASETGSPSLTTSQRRVNSRKTAVVLNSLTPKRGSRNSTPLNHPTTPSKQSTPKLARPTTPGKTPPSKNISMRTGSPKKLFKAEIEKSRPTPPPPVSNPLVRTDAKLNETIPSIILKPRHRGSSGLGIDKEGFGSPRVTALLDRRRSIGEDAITFAPQDNSLRGVRFDDPRVMEQELENQRKEDERRESGRGILQMEADSQEIHEEKDATANLKGLIESLTPQKKKLNGRKSLHVGAARGLLGKRPAELDEDDDEENLTPKRLKGREGSPVKKVRLPAPPSKVETTGRMTRSGRLSLAETTSNYNVSTPSRGSSLLKKSLATTPKDQPRFKDAERQSSAEKLTVPFKQKLETETVAAIAPAEQDDRIYLQDFLNMTSIRFMELTTTKRRLTVAPSIMLNSAKEPDEGAGFASSAEKASDLQNCVVAGACTVPMLELYQHSCRELKKYIAEGRSIVREIEADTFEENPPLFREYISAPQDIKSVMDNQFKNVKTHARLLSKAMWYEWRMKLLDGLKDGLLRVGEGMDEDDKLMAQQETILELVVPELVQEHQRLEADCQILQAQADEIANCNQEELQDARDLLIAVEEDFQTKQKTVEDLQRELRRQEERFGNVMERNQQCVEEIRAAEKIRREYRGWSPSEVAALQDSVDALEKAHGWAIVSTTSTSLTMTYRGTLQLLFTPSSFMQADPCTLQSAKPENSPISLTYIADADEYHPQVLTTEKRFFLQIMRAQLQCLPQSRMKIKNLLGLVSDNWEKSCTIAEEVSVLSANFITEPMIQSDEMMTVRSMLLLRDMRTRIEVGFEVTVKSQERTAELDVTIRPSAYVVYGGALKEKKMVEFLEQKIGGKRERGSWAKSVRELKERLMARGRKCGTLGGEI
ncbi:hypothetical protein MMC07_006601 [Pseudocyphellaria aurata]|nr:hypothetical protein [Pseudocyphellaria aurata]